MTNLERIRIELRDNNAKMFSDNELTAWLTDYRLNPNNQYSQRNKKSLMLSVREALRQLYRDLDSSKTVVRSGYLEGYNKQAIGEEIERITRQYDWDIVVGD